VDSYQSIELFFKRGLRVFPLEPDYFRAIMRKLRNNSEIGFVRYLYIKGPPPSAAGEEIGLDVLWSIQDSSWVLKMTSGHGRPSQNDFVRLYQDFDMLSSAVIDYYFGSEATIESWLVPLHKHPELSKDDVQLAILNARKVSRAEFGIIESGILAEARRNFSDSEWEIALSGAFLELKHINDRKQTCMVLRNGTIAFIVCD
jgi:hypothetical protein